VDNESKATMFTAPSFTGVVSLAGVTLPTADGAPGSVLETDGSGNCTWGVSATSHIGSQTNPHAVTKAQVGLGHVDNESKATMFTAPRFTGVVSLETIPGQKAVAIGLEAGQKTQGARAVAVGQQAGMIAQRAGGVAVGSRAGESDQGVNTVAVGADAGQKSQGPESVAVGKTAGKITQGNRAVAIGAGAGGPMQGAMSVCVGNSATSKFTGAICLGDGAVATANDMLVLGSGIVGGVPGAATAGLTIRIGNIDYYIALTAA
jgi:hypothetical protein